MTAYTYGDLRDYIMEIGEWWSAYTAFRSDVESIADGSQDAHTGTDPLNALPEQRRRELLQKHFGTDDDSALEEPYNPDLEQCALDLLRQRETDVGALLYDIVKDIPCLAVRFGVASAH